MHGGMGSLRGCRLGAYLCGQITRDRTSVGSNSAILFRLAGSTGDSGSPVAAFAGTSRRFIVRPTSVELETWVGEIPCSRLWCVLA